MTSLPHPFPPILLISSRLTRYQQRAPDHDLRRINRIPVRSNHAVRCAIYNSQSGTRWGTISTLSMGPGRESERGRRLLCENGRNRSSTRSITAPVTTEIPLIAPRGTRRVARAEIMLGDRHATAIIPDSV